MLSCFLYFSSWYFSCKTKIEVYYWLKNWVFLSRPLHAILLWRLKNPRKLISMYGYHFISFPLKTVSSLKFYLKSTFLSRKFFFSFMVLIIASVILYYVTYIHVYHKTYLLFSSFHPSFQCFHRIFMFFWFHCFDAIMLLIFFFETSIVISVWQISFSSLLYFCLSWLILSLLTF